MGEPVPGDTAGERHGPDKELGCSFCGQGRRHSKRRIAGPGAHICDECVALCQAIIDDRAEAAESRERMHDGQLRLHLYGPDRGACQFKA